MKRRMTIAETGTEGRTLAQGRLDIATAPEVEARLLALRAGAGVLLKMFESSGLDRIMPAVERNGASAALR